MESIIKDLMENKLNIKSNSILKIVKLNSLTNINYNVLSKDENLIIRFPGKGMEKVISREDEKHNIKFAYKNGFEAELLYFDTNTGIKISRFIENSIALNSNLAKKSENMKLIADKLYYLHNLDFKMHSEFDVLGKIDAYEDVLLEICGKLYKDYYEIKSKVQYLIKSYKKFEVICPCHNDLIAENILKAKEKIYFIDWEYAGMNDFMWDLASCSIEWGMSYEQEREFLNYYFENIYFDIELEQNRLAVYKVCQNFIWYIWSEIKIKQGENLEEYAKVRIQNVIKGICEIYRGGGY